MVNEVVLESISDQGMCYSAAPDFYGYYCAGFESPGEPDDHRRLFGRDSQDLYCSGMQTESLRYVYYTPSYEYAHFPYSHYNIYSPGMDGSVIGVGSQFAGAQHYFTTSAYQQPVSSPPFTPAIVQPGANFITNVSPEPLVFNPVTPCTGGVDAIGIQCTPSASAAVASSMQQSRSVVFGAELSQIHPNELHPSYKVPKRLQVDVTHINRHASDGAMSCTSGPLVTNTRDSAGIIQASDHLKAENVHSVLCPLKVTALMYNGSGNLGPNALARVTVDRVRSRLQSGGVLKNANGRPTMLVEQHRGPRMRRSKGLWTSLVVKAYTTKAGPYNPQGNITICPDQYNREDFPVNHSDAKFFIIKSYSDDDVHKSIKYSVWSSTTSGNKRLNSAYEGARRIYEGSMSKCPVFLFFSVNGSGQFCGVAEMTGPVDFNRDMDFWLQDKWAGSFPVRWHIIKDVPNASFRHIILENNENRPVTNSRDTQEVKYMPGMSMLNIFKNSPLRMSIFDDFMYYEECQRIMFEEKSRLFGRSYGNTLFLPAFASNKPIITIKHPPKMEEKPLKPEDSMKSLDVSADNESTSKSEHSGEANDRELAMSEACRNADGLEFVTKFGSFSIDSREGEADQSATLSATVEPVEYITVGLMPVKVDGFGDTSSGILTVGTIPFHPEAAKQKHLNGCSACNSPFREEGVIETS